MSEYAWFTGTFIMTIVLIVLLIDMATYNSQIQCPETVKTMHEQIDNSTDVVGNTLTLVGMFISPCAGLPWWVYLFLVILMVADIIFVLPFIGG
jgi:hypothetical protein